MNPHKIQHLLSIRDLAPGATTAIFAKAKTYKANRKHPDEQPLSSQTWAMIFTKSSTRTRLSFEIAIQELGGFPLFLNSSDIQLGRGELIRDTARVMSRMLHGVIIRTHAHQDLVEFADYGRIPVVNALSDDEHPCQILTDIFTYEEKQGSIAGKKVAFIGDAACNVARSWIYAAELFKFHLTLASPAGYESSVSNAHTRQTRDPREAADGADLLYTDVWVSMGKEKEAEERHHAFTPYQINHSLLSLARKNAIVFHCLPAYRGKEISESLFEERSTDIFDQAENRLHVQKGILHWLVH